MLTAAVTACWAHPPNATSSTPRATPLNQHAAEFLFSLIRNSNHDGPSHIDNDRFTPTTVGRWHICCAEDKPTYSSPSPLREPKCACLQHLHCSCLRPAPKLR